MLTILNVVTGTLIALAALLAFVTSLREGERRAALLSFAALLLNCAFWLTLILKSSAAFLRTLNVIVLSGGAVLVVVSLLKFFPKEDGQLETEAVDRYDERDQMFARNGLKFDDRHKEIYYERLRPEFLETDAAIHAKPELGEAGAVYYDRYFSPAFAAAFTFLSRLKPLTAGEPNGEKRDPDPAGIKAAIRKLAICYGAADVGFVKLKSHHLYSYRGRDPESWGEPVECDHKSAIVIVVAMRVASLKRAPLIEEINESARSYTEAAKVACIVAEYLRLFGCRARAHTDGNYLAPLVPLAAEAGLGEVGRMGLLIHPVLGPCLRIAMVSADLELPPDKVCKFGAANFCRICRKCADNCPTKSISQQDRPAIDRGVAHWRIVQEKCYSFWKSAGTDCGLCIAVCPYTKENRLFHRLVRWYISRNPINQRLALFFDDIFYGRRRRIPPCNQSVIRL